MTKLENSAIVRFEMNLPSIGADYILEYQLNGKRSVAG